MQFQFQKQFHKSVIGAVIVGIKEARVTTIAEDRPLVLARALYTAANTLSNLDWSDEEDIFDATKLADEMGHYVESNGYQGRALTLVTTLTEDLQKIVDSIKV